MANFVFDNCCFCVELRIGCFIIGYLNLIGSAIETIASMMVVASSVLFAVSTDADKHNEGVVFVAIGIITLLVVAVLFAFDIVLLVGLHKHRPGHVKAYLIYNYIFLAIFLILLIVNLGLAPYDGSIIIERVLVLLVSTYCIMVIRSYYYQMLEDAAGPPRYL